MSCAHTDWLTCPYCSPSFTSGPKPVTVNPYGPAVVPTAYPPKAVSPDSLESALNITLNPHAPAVVTPSPQLKTVSSDCLEGALNERRRIVEVLKNVGYGELAGKIDRGEL